MLIAQISDTHILKNKDEKLFNVNTANNLALIADHISQLPVKPEYIILSGDISDDQTTASYQIVSDLIAPLKIKTIFIPGNHDNKNVMVQMLTGNMFINTKYINIADWHLILLDSCLPNEAFGLISENELNFLDVMLKFCRNERCCIFIHHHPIVVESPLIDQYILKNKDAFLSVLNKYSFKKNIFFGHIHQIVEKIVDNNFFFSCPSSAFQLKPKTNTLSFDMSFIGYRLIEIKKEDISTTVIKLNKAT